MSNYSSTEVGLTKLTKELLRNKPKEHVYPMQEFTPLPVKVRGPDLKPRKTKREKLTKLMLEDLESFQHHRIFATIRGMN